MKTFLQNLKWFIIRILGRKYFIKYTDRLSHDEILVRGHVIYIQKQK